MTPPNFSLDLIVSEARTVLSLKDDDRKPWRAGTEEYLSTLSTKITGGKPRSLCTQMTHREAKRISALVHQRRSHRENMEAPLGSISYPRLPGTTTKNPLKIKKNKQSNILFNLQADRKASCESGLPVIVSVSFFFLKPSQVLQNLQLKEILAHPKSILTHTRVLYLNDYKLASSVTSTPEMERV